MVYFNEARKVASSAEVKDLQELVILKRTRVWCFPPPPPVCVAERVSERERDSERHKAACLHA